MLVLLWLTAGSLGGCVAAPQPPEVPMVGNAVIYVVGRGWHTDIGLPVDEVHGPLADLERDFPGIRFMVFGFGERNYLMTHGNGSGEMLTTLFPSKGAILMTALRAPPTEAFSDEQVVTLRLTQNGVVTLSELIWQALEKTPVGAAQRLADGPYAGSVFYASGETYDAFHTCNTWTALLLRDAGLAVDPRGVLFVGQVMRQAGAIAAVQARQNR
jgi:hypothetical protein